MKQQDATAGQQPGHAVGIRNSFFTLCCCVLAATMFAGCAVGPNYEPPATQMPENWAAELAGGETAKDAELLTWWMVLNDPLLDSLIEQARENNLDLQLASARIREARAVRGLAMAGFWPFINVGTSYAYRGSSLNAVKPPRTSSTPRINPRLPSISIVPGAALAGGGFGPPTITVIPPGSGGGSTGGTTSSSSSTASTARASRASNTFQTGLEVSWELDVWGGIRRDVEAAEAEIAAACEDRASVMVSLVAEVARNYVSLRGFQRRLAIARENIRTQQESVDLARTRYEAGLTSELDFAQAQAQLASTLSTVPSLEAAIQLSAHQLGVLLGRPPGELLEELAEVEPIPVPPVEVPVGLPSDLLRRRPDIRAAERALAAATARIGVAVADLFPIFSLNGSIGTQTYDCKYLFDRNSVLWSVGPSIQWPIFQGGARLANIELANAREEQAAVVYQQAILVALQDVENALVSYAKEQTRRAALAQAVQANRRAFELASEQYRRGLVAFLNVLESQRSMYISQDALVQSETTMVENLIALYRALGGGWRPEDACGRCIPPTTQPM